MREKLREQLAALDMTQAELGRMIGVGPVSVNRWATGKRPVPTWLWSYLRLVGEVRTLARKLGALGGIERTRGKP